MLIALCHEYFNDMINKGNELVGQSDCSKQTKQLRIQLSCHSLGSAISFYLHLTCIDISTTPRHINKWKQVDLELNYNIDVTASVYIGNCPRLDCEDHQSGRPAGRSSHSLDQSRISLRNSGCMVRRG